MGQGWPDSASLRCSDTRQCSSLSKVLRGALQNEYIPEEQAGADSKGVCLKSRQIQVPPGGKTAEGA